MSIDPKEIETVLLLTAEDRYEFSSTKYLKMASCGRFVMKRKVGQHFKMMSRDILYFLYGQMKFLHNNVR